MGLKSLATSHVRPVILLSAAETVSEMHYTLVNRVATLSHEYAIIIPVVIVESLSSTFRRSSLIKGADEPLAEKEDERCKREFR